MADPIPLRGSRPLVPRAWALDVSRFSHYSLDLPAALALAQRFFAAAEIFALAAALILRLAFLTVFATGFVPFTFAHLAFCAAAILALPAALIFRLRFGSASVTDLDGEPKSLPIRFSSVWILSFMPAA